MSKVLTFVLLMIVILCSVTLYMICDLEGITLDEFTATILELKI